MLQKYKLYAVKNILSAGRQLCTVHSCGLKQGCRNTKPIGYVATMSYASRSWKRPAIMPMLPCRRSQPEP